MLAEVHVEATFVHAALGESAQLECIVQGSPEPTVKWYKGSMRLSDTERQLAIRDPGNRYRLAITPVIASDFGKYSCVCKNSLGKERGRVTLTGT